MILEYLVSNSLNKYPFDDSCSLKSNDGFTIPNDYILDIYFCEKTNLNYTVSLIEFINDTVGETITFIFNVRDTADSLLETGISFVIAHSDIIIREVVYYNTTTWNIRLIPGQGLIDLITVNTALDKTFDEANAKLAQSALVSPVPRVTSIALYNVDELFTTITGNELSLNTFELEEGANMSFTQDGLSASIAVIPGAGTGLYNPCGDDLVILDINNIGPDSAGNFLFLTDDCYTSEKEDHGLFITNICTPKCTDTQFDNYAHYLNRIKDAITTLNGYVTTLADDLLAAIATYESDIVPVKNLPYYKYTYAKYPTPHGLKDYYSVVLGFFNPTTSDIALSIAVTGSGLHFESGTIRYKSADTTVILESASYTGIVPCIGVGQLEFILISDSSITLDLSGSLGGQPISGSITLT